MDCKDRMKIKAHAITEHSGQGPNRHPRSSSPADDGDGDHDFFPWEQKYRIPSGPKRLAERVNPCKATLL